MKKLIKNRYVQLILAVLMGATIGVIFYPSKRIESKYERNIQRLTEENKKKIEKIKQEKQELQRSLVEYRESLTAKIATLKVENRQLKSSMKRRKIKIVKPDGTILEKSYEESKSEEITQIVTQVRSEFERKVASIESKWKKVHLKRIKEVRATYEKQIKELEKEKSSRTTLINPKSLRSEIGITTDLYMYAHTTYSLFGPVFIGGGSTFDVLDKKFKEARLGLGLEF